MINFMVGTFSSMSIIKSDQLIACLYLSFKHINEKIWEIITSNQIKELNIVAFYNLQTDLVALFEVCNNNYYHCTNLMECLRELRQLLDLFLLNNPLDYLEGNNRYTKYSHLNPEKLIFILEKYVKLKTKNKDLHNVRKRECKPVYKKLREELGWKIK
ncbi:hypothetical protein IMG5_196210 [Ichthyophthirius multifiliis]|uniref:Exocyst complex subunit EXOC6/Sec15 C-terminal domain-containing protein n=1 Tax=Ichthyophthirius multifiliis TaxID=5932 RepID=G0R536_ICHMU|nr:hypothetical protein IMG5_196210 [Ichthyophthirius multifiliis]EGR27438.1 hypothetical protein IMG5_196210 [Ichthyophthirius multifiliis]|eukprot:XP_004024348.1 hypothetical protein IMG5_196210 [Ichthyophthirius multifiliis]